MHTVQISEIFNLFDTDGGGTIDMGELDFAMNALGFRSTQAGSNDDKDNEAQAALDAIAADGSVPSWRQEEKVSRCTSSRLSGGGLGKLCESFCDAIEITLLVSASFCNSFFSFS
jgi:hypothetical protein